jgi:RNA polymerase sigma-70 factor (ECF subfamily)
MAQSPSRDVRFRHIFDAHEDAMRAYCFRRLPPEDANDAVAEVFLVAWRKIGKAPAGDEARLWLYGIARNVVRNAHRSARRSERLSARLAGVREEHEPGPEVQVVRSARDAELLAAVARLAPLERELLRLKTWEELSSAQIAEVAGLSVRAVETRLSRIRKKLAKWVAVPASPSVMTRPQPVEEGGER